MKIQVASDYDAWQMQLRNWPSVEDFCADTAIMDGIHTINVGDGPTLDILVEGNLFDNPYTAIPVFFTGAISARETKSGPFFSGGGLATEGGFAYIAVSDPSTSLDSSLGLAWYAGNSYSDLPLAIERSLAHIARATGRHLLLVGGSGGGFAALHLGCRLGDRASVLAWNPQTNILRYNAVFSKNYFLHAFGADIEKHLESDNWERGTQGFLDDRSFRYELCTLSSGRPRRLIVFQNASDWHVQSHAAPLISAWGFEHRGQGRYHLGMGGRLVIADFGDGHEPLPSSVVLKAVLTLGDPMATADHAVDLLLEMPEFARSDARTIPRDLRHLSGAIEKDIQLSVERHSTDSLRLQVNHNHSPTNYGGLTYSFFTTSRDGRVTRSPFGPDSFLIVNTSVTSYAEFGVLVRDGFHNTLLELQNSNPHLEISKEN